jgi:DNA-binding IclR family transcriptional regulator
VDSDSPTVEAGDRHGSVQSLERAAAILRVLAQAGASGTRLADVATAIGLGKTTTHRLINALLDLGFVDQDKATRRYRLGLEVYALATAAQSRLVVVELARPSLVTLAEQTGDTVFLSIIDRYEAVCVDRQVGSFPIRTLTLNIGDRRPLGTGSGSLALLAALPDDDIRRALEINSNRQLNFPGYDVSEIYRLVAETRTNRYAFNNGRIVSGMSAVAIAVPGADGKPAAAISVAAIADRMQPERRRQIVDLLQREASIIADRLDPARHLSHVPTP